MKVEKKQLELLEVNEDAYFNVKGYGYSFECEFILETSRSKSELDYNNGTGLQEDFNIDFIDICYISSLYDADNNEVDVIDIDKTILEELIINKVDLSDYL